MTRIPTPAQYRANERLVEALTGDGVDLDEARELIGDYWRANMFPEMPPPADAARVVTVTRHRDGTADTAAYEVPPADQGGRIPLDIAPCSVNCPCRAFDRANTLAADTLAGAPIVSFEVFADNRPIVITTSDADVRADLDEDPIIVALARELAEAPEPIRRSFLADGPVGEGMRNSAQSEYRRRGGKGAPLIGQVAGAITRVLEQPQEAPADAAERLAVAGQLAAALGDALPGDNWHMADVIRRLCAGEITPAEALAETDDE